MYLTRSFPVFLRLRFSASGVFLLLSLWVVSSYLFFLVYLSSSQSMSVLVGLSFLSSLFFFIAKTAFFAFFPVCLATTCDLGESTATTTSSSHSTNVDLYLCICLFIYLPIYLMYKARSCEIHMSIGKEKVSCVYRMYRYACAGTYISAHAYL